ncbi:homocysteine S-methyltransferase family protein [Psychromonas sp. SR45-3]|uniref:homocysteine S-methyltransferase family protein n=1 Tax=Psychromonas sp. SR45-3 TaxID=2760930 RepID=UPI0015FD1D5D|nr:homocysteine S-methyltransferase family protein [Psychromonas sp. SR45-3]MBB1271241.1 homocysteine S-methyltransferase family protein [Psychromonas sp. SR45-3]
MKKLTILDGGMGRELKRIGAPFSQPLWSAQALIEAPYYVAQAHQGFIDAGADMIIANSYACVPFHLGETLYQQQGSALAEQAAIIAKDVAKAAKKNVLVAGSLPPAFGSYRPDLFESEGAFDILSTLFNAQDKHVDIWLAETISSIEEALVMSNVLKHSIKPCHYAFTLSDEIEQVARLRSGESVIEAVNIILNGSFNENIDGIFFNCSIPEVIEQAIADTNQALSVHNIQANIGVFANSFTPIASDYKANEGVQAYRELSPEAYLEFAKKWYDLGANIIGGCCGIRPDHIQALVQWRDSIEEY